MTMTPRSKFGRVTGANFFIVAMFSDALQNRPVSAAMKAPADGALVAATRPGGPR